MKNQTSESVTTQNRLLSTLIVINIILVVLVVYFFIGNKKLYQANINTKTVTQKVNKTMTTEPVVAYSFEAAAQIAATARNTENSNQSNLDNLVDIEATDSKVNQQTDISKTLETINESLDDIGELSSKDAIYVKALEELKKEVSAQINTKKPTVTEAAARKVNLDSGEQSVDYFNKVDVSTINKQLALTSDKYKLIAKIEKIIAEPEDTNTKPTTTIKKADDSYIKTLKTASEERANEMRSIQVKRGDSLWLIAVRAYGDGYQYPRIFAANPSLTDPDRIEVGTYLLVPL
ncbi:MAG: LysM peptidoglycan-binding domain-containing protein [Methylococcales bacterium]